MSAISVADDVAIASMMVYDAYDKDTSFNYEFKKNAETAFNTEEADTFTANGVTYRFEKIADSKNIEYIIYKVDDGGEKSTPWLPIL